MTWLSQRVLPVLQLTRMALVFTAIADSLCALMIWAAANAAPGQHPLELLRWPWVIAIVMVSIGLYGYGMSLNDIIDRRRDRQLAADRPLPSGRVGVAAAHVICVLLALLALTAGAWYAWNSPAGWMALLLVVWTGMLITFYDTAGKYLVAPGLITLGLIRFFHAAVPAPTVPLLWHPLWLLNHVVILSTVAYTWEAKRPVLTRGHWWAVAGGLAALNALAIGGFWYRRGLPLQGTAGWMDVFWISSGLIWPALAAGGFILLALVVRQRTLNRRAAGQKLMLYGLLWLIVYDAAFAAGYVGLVPGLLLLLLAPIAYLSVRLMRWWSMLLAASQKPTFKRAPG
jgi:hypothetical protein